MTRVFDVRGLYPAGLETCRACEEPERYDDHTCEDQVTPMTPGMLMCWVAAAGLLVVTCVVLATWSVTLVDVIFGAVFFALGLMGACLQRAWGSGA